MLIKWDIKAGLVELIETNPEQAKTVLKKLTHVDLRYVDLRRANLRLANLRHTDLSLSDLEGANLHASSLQGATGIIHIPTHPFSIWATMKTVQIGCHSKSTLKDWLKVSADEAIKLGLEKEHHAMYVALLTGLIPAIKQLNN